MLARDQIATSLFPLLLAGLLAAMTFWLERAARPPTTGMDGKTRHDPDYMVDNFSVRRFGVDGQLQNTLRAEHMRHFPDDDSTLVRRPDLTYHRLPPTQVTAREGYLNSGATEIKLADNVVVTRGAAQGKPASVLSTSLLYAYPEEETAHTHVPVTITQGQSTVRGSGLKADNKTALYILDGPVNGTFYRQGGNVLAAAAPIAKPTASPAVAKPKQKTNRKTQRAKPAKPRPNHGSKS